MESTHNYIFILETPLLCSKCSDNFCFYFLIFLFLLLILCVCVCVCVHVCMHMFANDGTWLSCSIMWMALRDCLFLSTVGFSGSSGLSNRIFFNPLKLLQPFEFIFIQSYECFNSLSNFFNKQLIVHETIL